MKLVWIFLIVSTFGFILAEDNPGFFLKFPKNVPRLGKRNNFKQGVKNVPRLGRRSGRDFTASRAEDLKSYNHVQPFDSKFILDFLSDDQFIGEGDLKFVAWEDFDKILESDAELKKKLSSVARDKEMEDLKKLVYNTGSDDDAYGRSAYKEPVYQTFVPYDRNNFKYNNVENDVYYYHQNNDVKRSGVKEMK